MSGEEFIIDFGATILSTFTGILLPLGIKLLEKLAPVNIESTSFEDSVNKHHIPADVDKEACTLPAELIKEVLIVSSKDSLTLISNSAGEIILFSFSNSFFISSFKLLTASNAISFALPD